MKILASGLAKCALFVLAIIGIVYRDAVWAWVDGKSISELSELTAGFLIKWVVLGFLFYAAATLPHYVKPYLELFRLKGITKVKTYRKKTPVPSQKVPAQRGNFAEQLLTRMYLKQNPPQYRQPQKDPRNEIKLRF